MWEYVTSYFASVVGEVKNRSPLSKDPSCALSTYLRPQGLSKLGILIKEKTTLSAGSPNWSHILVMGYLLCDWWHRHYNHSYLLLANKNKIFNHKTN